MLYLIFDIKSYLKRYGGKRGKNDKKRLLNGMLPVFFYFKFFSENGFLRCLSALNAVFEKKVTKMDFHVFFHFFVFGWKK